MNYYTIPLKIEEIIKGKNLEEEADVRESIHQNIQLMLKTLSLSYRFDPTFGCVMNKYHARTPPQNQAERAWRESLREAIQKNLKDMLTRYETRIKVTDVIVDMHPPRKGAQDPVVKVKVDIFGQLKLGRREQFHYPDREIDEGAQEVFPLEIPVGRK